MGHTKVFLRYWQADHLNDRCHHLTRKVIICQKGAATFEMVILCKVTQFGCFGEIISTPVVCHWKKYMFCSINCINFLHICIEESIEYVSMCLWGLCVY